MMGLVADEKRVWIVEQPPLTVKKSVRHGDGAVMTRLMPRARSCCACGAFNKRETLARSICATGSSNHNRSDEPTKSSAELSRSLKLVPGGEAGAVTA